jgi:hypothetical protein
VREGQDPGDAGLLLEDPFRARRSSSEPEERNATWCTLFDLPGPSRPVIIASWWWWVAVWDRKMISWSPLALSGPRSVTSKPSTRQ